MQFSTGKRLSALAPAGQSTLSALSRMQQSRSMASKCKYPFEKLLASNRGEIAVRIMRAANELGIRTAGIFSYEDRFTQHRYKADESYLVGFGKTPVGAYLDIPGIIDIAVRNGIDAVHPGYGFLSEKEEFAQACADNGITFVGPTVKNLQTFGDKTSARELAIKVGVPVIPGTDGPVSTVEEARAFIENGVGYPVICKATMGGGGRGMRVVESAEDLEENFTRASSEALAAFGDGTMFIERYLKNPRHIEVQLLGDGQGNVVHLYDRDCSLQRRHQKVLETAPATHLSKETREAMFADAVKLARATNYKNAGTVEFLVDSEGRHYFIEVNPRIQVEHTVTEEITGIDLVQSQIRIASGETLEDLKLKQDNIFVNGHAMQCRVTTENPVLNFQPDNGVIEVFRAPGGMGVRLDDGPGFTGAHITPHYDSLLVKVTARALDRKDCANKLERALSEFRVRGVSTNKHFLLNVLRHPSFLEGTINTGFIAENPELLKPARSTNRGTKLVRYIGNVIVNGPEKSLRASGAPCSRVNPIVPEFEEAAIGGNRPLRQIYVEDGPKAFAKAVRDTKGLLITDTTWRDAHQSLLATRMRTEDMVKIAKATRVALKDAYSLEMWGGATFDVAMRFLRECPWDRLGTLRELVPDIPFQMLLRGANAVGYTSYPDNVVYKFCEQAKNHGMDVFRVFDSLNYIDNMRLGIDAVGQAGGIIEAAVCYTGDVLHPRDGRYDLDYYLKFVRELVAQGIHVLAIKDMAGLLREDSARMLVSAIREEFPDLPIHVHTHDTAGVGVSAMLAAAKAGADVVDVATDGMSGTTSQPSMGAVVASLKHDKILGTGVDMEKINSVNEYWEMARGLYAPFESGQKSGSADVYDHEMPGGQYTNLLFQSQQLGLSQRWPAIKKAYAAANRLLGDIVKVTPSSKVVGDLAQFMVQNDLSESDVLEQAENLSFPQSVVEYFQGYLGIPSYGFPEPLRSKVLKHQTLPNGKKSFEGRPGEELPPFDFDEAKKSLQKKYSSFYKIRDVDVMSYVMYPKVFEEYMKFKEEYGNVDFLPTRAFVQGLEVGEEIQIEIEHGKTIFLKLNAVGEVSKEDGMRNVIFELNGRQRVVKIKDNEATATTIQHPKADPTNSGSIGAPMPGVVLEVRVKKGQVVEEGEPLVVLSAMKMETVVAAPATGRVERVHATVGANYRAGDLLVEIDETGAKAA